MPAIAASRLAFVIFADSDPESAGSHRGWKPTPDGTQNDIHAV